MISFNIFAYLIKFNIIILSIIFLLLGSFCVLCILFNKWLAPHFGLSSPPHPVLRPRPPGIPHHNLGCLLVDLDVELIVEELPSELPVHELVAGVVAADDNTRGYVLEYHAVIRFVSFLTPRTETLDELLS